MNEFAFILIAAELKNQEMQTDGPSSLMKPRVHLSGGASNLSSLSSLPAVSEEDLPGMYPCERLIN